MRAKISIQNLTIEYEGETGVAPALPSLGPLFLPQHAPTPAALPAPEPVAKAASSRPAPRRITRTVRPSDRQTVRPPKLSKPPESPPLPVSAPHPNGHTGPNWGLYPRRVAIARHPACRICQRPIDIGDYYRDGGIPSLRGHEECVKARMQQLGQSDRPTA